jgi:RHS repeat-associated protein
LDGRLESIESQDIATSTPNDSISFIYDDPTGRVKTVTLPNNLSRTFNYDNSGRVFQMTQNRNGTAETYGYTYDGAGKMKTHVLPEPGTSIVYTYDAANRLEREERLGVNPYINSYTYDRNDNRLTQSGTVARSFGYNSMNQLKTINQGTQVTKLDYNNIGQLITRTVNTIETHRYDYDRMNRLRTLTINGVADAYTYYGATWMRKTSKTGSNPATSYVYDGFACVSQTTNGTKTRYCVPGQEPLWERTGTTALVYAQDGRGNITGLWNGTSYAAKFSYDAFGNVKTTDGAGLALNNTSGPRYRGEMYDAGTDQIYLRNRCYDPSTGRFLSLDPAGMVDGPNMYGYCGGDPVNRSDPMGTDWYINQSTQKLTWFNGKEEIPGYRRVPQSFEEQFPLHGPFNQNNYIGNRLCDENCFEAEEDYFRYAQERRRHEWMQGRHFDDGSGRLEYQAIGDPNTLLADETRQLALTAEGAACAHCHPSYRDWGFSAGQSVGLRERNKAIAGLATLPAGGAAAFAFGAANIVDNPTDPSNYLMIAPGALRSGQLLTNAAMSTNTGKALFLTAALNSELNVASRAKDIPYVQSIVKFKWTNAMDFSGGVKISSNGLNELQTLAAEANSTLASNPAIARTVLTAREYAAGKHPKIVPMSYGNAVERIVAEKIENDQLMDQLFQHVGGPNRPDFIGRGPYTGLRFDITTPRGAASKPTRPYWPMLVPTYNRPSSIKALP